MNRIAAGLFAVALVTSIRLDSQATRILHRGGAEHGFLVLHDAEGALLASGELTQAASREGMKMRVVFHFLDGSVDDETVVYSQHHVFRLLSDRHIQTGHSFPHPIDATVDMNSQQVSVHDLSTDKEAVKTEHMKLPPDLANGLLFLMIQNLRPGAAVEVPYVAFGPEPRMVKLAIAPEGEAEYKVAGRPYEANKYDIKAHLGGLVGVIAPMIGKQPPDYHVWVSKGSVPEVLRIDGPFYTDGPIWSAQLASPTW
jgi:hypothetical protein